LRWLADGQRNIPEARAAAERIIRDGHRAGEVIASIRALAKKSPPQTAAVNLNEAILDVLVLARNELDRAGIVVETDLSDDAACAFGDRVRMQQVILNLVMNGIEAISASRNKTRMLRIQTRLGDAGFILTTVADTGVGLAGIGVDQIFEVFFTTKSDGIGIGLSICRSIVEAHGGRLWATPGTTQGAAFHFTVPVLPAERVH
jgi:signal transduction histidine kinase